MFEDAHLTLVFESCVTWAYGLTSFVSFICFFVFSYPEYFIQLSDL